MRDKDIHTAVREVFEETSITTEIKRMVGIRCDRKTWYLLFEMDYVDGLPTSSIPSSFPRFREYSFCSELFQCS